MKYLSSFSLLLLAALGFQACETDITRDVKISTTPDLVVTSFISPQDTALEVHVTKSRPVVGQVITPDAALVTNATVRISQGGQSVLLTYHPERRLYRAKASLLPVQAGQTYTLSVTTPDHYAVSGTCTVPLTTGITVTDLAHSVRKQSWWDGNEYDEHVLTFKWQDVPGRENFYHPAAEREYQDPNPNGQLRLRDAMHGEGKVYFSDQNKDGLVFTASRSYSILPGQPDPRPADLHLYLAVTDRAYYLYHQSLDQHEDTNGNPFAEPVLIYSNVTGGLGVFAAYNQIKASYRLN
ncbi:MAG: DUF4249 domain-containing protein [Adhaeribacter sp.]